MVSPSVVTAAGGIPAPEEEVLVPAPHPHHHKGRSEDKGVHQIDQGLFLCAVDELFDTERLKALGVTHILNIAEETLYDRKERGDLDMLDRGQGPQIPLKQLLQPFDVRCLNTQDVETQDLTPYFEE